MKRAASILIIVLTGTIFFQCNGKQGNIEQNIIGSSASLHSEDKLYIVEFIVSNMSDQKIYLAEFMKTSYAIIDSTVSTNGSFYFSFLPEQHPGTYRIYFGRADLTSRNAPEHIYIEFIWNLESFSIFADYQDIKGSVKFENSPENNVLGQFREYENLYEEKMSALYPLIDRYPTEDEFFVNVSDHFVSLQHEREEFISGLSAKYPDLYVADLMKAYLSLILQPGLKGPERMIYLRRHFFDKAAINQPKLLSSPVYNHKIIEYLSLYRNQNNSYTQQEDAFIEAADIIMANVSADPDLRSFVVEYLLEGFNSFQMERVQTYIAENYVDETCTTDAVELALHRVEGYKKMVLGAEASDFRVEDYKGESIVLSKIKSDFTIVIFWASDCEHCVRMMPGIKEWYLSDRPDNVEVLAISLDTVRTDWKGYVEKMKLPWINANEPLGWDGKSAADYNVYATPTIFILDKKRIIRAKPLTQTELIRDIEELVLNQ